MNYVAKYSGVALIVLGLLLCGHNAQAQADPAAPAADPAVWGIYTQLVGTEWGGGGEKVDWRWGPDNTIVESRTLMMKTVIRAGASPGELVSVYGGGLHTFDGRVSPDGSILWIRRGRFVKMPLRVSIVEGRYSEEMVKLDEANQVAKVTLTTRFVQTTGRPVGSSAALAVTTAAPAADVILPSSASSPAQPLIPPPALATGAAGVSSASVTPSARPSFGVMDAVIGQVLVGQVGKLMVTTSEDGAVLTLSGSRDNMSFRHSATPGQLTVLTYPGYSGATASLDASGKLVVLTKGSLLNGVHQRITYSATSEGGLSRYSEYKPRALVSGLLSWDFDSQYSFRPNNQENVRRAAAEKRYSAQQAQENRQAGLELKAAYDQSYNAMMGDLSAHAARETQTRADADEMLARVNRQAERARQARIQEQQAEARSTQERRLQLTENARRLADTPQPAGERRQQSATQGPAAGKAPVTDGSLTVETPAAAKAGLPAPSTASTPRPVPSQQGGTHNASYYYWVKEDDQNRKVMYISDVISLPYSTLQVRNRPNSSEAWKAYIDKCGAFLETIRSRYAGHVRWAQPCPEGFSIGAPKSVRGDDGPSLEQSRAREVQDMKRHFRVVEVRLPGN